MSNYSKKLLSLIVLCSMSNRAFSMDSGKSDPNANTDKPPFIQYNSSGRNPQNKLYNFSNLLAEYERDIWYADLDPESKRQIHEDPELFYYTMRSLLSTNHPLYVRPENIAKQMLLDRVNNGKQK